MDEEFKMKQIKVTSKQAKVTITPRNRVNLFISYELDIWSRDLNAGFTLKGYLVGAVKLTTNPDPNKYANSVYDIGFDSRSTFFLYFVKNVFSFGVANNSSYHHDNLKN